MRSITTSQKGKGNAYIQDLETRGKQLLIDVVQNAFEVVRSRMKVSAWTNLRIRDVKRGTLMLTDTKACGYLVTI